MIYRGCIVKLEKDFAIVMTDTMEYLKVVKKEGLRVGGQIMFVKEDLYREKSTSLKPILSIAAVFIIMIMSVTLSGLFTFPGFVANGAAAVVSLDINPSLELEVNSNHEVIRVITLNREAKDLVDENIKGMNIKEALFLIIDKAKIKKYITEEKNSVLISTVILKDDFQLDHIDLEKETEEKWIEEDNEIELNLMYVEGDKDDLQEARKQKVSMGKYEVYKSSLDSNENLTIEAVKNMKVQEIKEKEILKPNKDKENNEEKNSNGDLRQKEIKDKDTNKGLKNKIEKDEKNDIKEERESIKNKMKDGLPANNKQDSKSNGNPEKNSKDTVNKKDESDTSEKDNNKNDKTNNGNGNINDKKGNDNKSNDNKNKNNDKNN